MLLSFIKSILITASISLLVSIPFVLLGAHIFYPFCISFFSIFALSFLFKEFMFFYTSYKNKELEIKEIEAMEKTGIELTCPCHKQVKMFVPIDLATENVYKCPGCDKNISAIVNIQTALHSDSVQIPEIFESLEKTLKTHE